MMNVVADRYDGCGSNGRAVYPLLIGSLPIFVFSRLPLFAGPPQRRALLWAIGDFQMQLNTTVTSRSTLAWRQRTATEFAFGCLQGAPAVTHHEKPIKFATIGSEELFHVISVPYCWPPVTERDGRDSFHIPRNSQYAGSETYTYVSIYLRQIGNR